MSEVLRPRFDARIDERRGEVLRELFECSLCVLRDEIEFRTGWFLESVVSATLIVLVIRSRRPPLRSRPSRPLAVTTILVIAITLILPWTPVAAMLGFAPLPLKDLVVLLTIVATYVISAEFAKRVYFKVFNH